MKDIKLVALDLDGTLFDKTAAASANAILRQSAALQTKASMS